MISRTKRMWTAGFVALLAMVCLFPFLLQSPAIYDEGIMVVGAVRAAHGAVPYRDFYAIYPPGGFYTLGGIFRLFGYSFLVERLWSALVRFGICLALFLIGRRLVSTKASYLPCLVAALILLNFRVTNFVPEAMFFSLAGVLLLLRSFAKNRMGWIFLGGLAAGMATLYRIEVGVWTMFSATLAVLLCGPGELPGAPPASAKLIQRLKALLSLGGGACAVVVPALFWLVRTVPLSDLRLDLVEYPRIYSQTRSLPLPPILPRLSFLTYNHGVAYDYVFFYGPLAVYAISCVGLARSLWKSGAGLKGTTERFGWLVLTLLGSFLVTTALVRPDFPHFVAMALPATVLVPLMVSKYRTANRRGWGAGLASVALAVTAAVYIAGQVAMYRGVLLQALHPPASFALASLPRGRGLHLDRGQLEAAGYVQQNVPKGDAIFVGDARHGQASIDDVSFYFLADRRPGTRYYHFDPGVITTAAVQQQVIRDLESNQVNYVVICSNPGLLLDHPLPFGSGATLLDDFLQARYRKVRTFGYYSVWRRG